MKEKVVFGHLGVDFCFILHLCLQLLIFHLEESKELVFVDIWLSSPIFSLSPRKEFVAELGGRKNPSVLEEQIEVLSGKFAIFALKIIGLLSLAWKFA